MKNIYYTTKNEYILNTPELHPQPIHKVIPKWFRDLKAFDEDIKTVKSCPSFVDKYGYGFVNFASQDYQIDYIKDTDSWEWRTNTTLIHKKYTVHAGNNEIEYHNPKQLTEHIPNNKYFLTLKITLPYRVVVPKGYSIRQETILFNDNENYDLVNGTWHADRVHSFSVFVLVKKKESFVIKQGTPLVVHVPYKREIFKSNFIEQSENKKVNKRILQNDLLLQGKIFNKYWRNKFHKEQ